MLSLIPLIFPSAMSLFGLSRDRSLCDDGTLEMRPSRLGGLFRTISTVVLLDPRILGTKYLKQSPFT